MDQNFVFNISIQCFFDVITRFLEELHNILGWCVKQIKDFVFKITLEARVDI